MNQAKLGLKVFAVTKARDREHLGEVITEWIRKNPTFQILGKVVLQSSDAEFHCFTIVLLYQQA